MHTLITFLMVYFISLVRFLTMNINYVIDKGIFRLSSSYFSKIFIYLFLDRG